MADTSTIPAAPKKTVSPRHGVLEDLIAIAVKHAGDQYLELATKLAGALIDATDGDTRAIQQRLRAGNMLRNRHFAFLHLATECLEKVLRHEIAELAPAVNAKLGGGLPMALVPFEEMDTRVALGGVSKPFESLYSDALQTLNVRLAFLLDRDILRVSQNPFRPEVFLMALQRAWLAFDPEPESAPLLQPLIKPGMFIELGPMFEALNLALQSKGVLPGSVDGYRGRKADAAPGAAGERARDSQAALAQQLRQFFASSDVAGSAAGELVDDIAGGLLHGAGGIDLRIPDLPPSALYADSGRVQGAAPGLQSRRVGDEQALRRSATGVRRPLFAHLAQLQATTRAGVAGAGGADGEPAPGDAAATPANVFYLPNIKQSLPQGSLTRADESTIDLLTAIFDTVFRDQNISQEIRDLIRFLQIPVLKAALADKNFFFQEEHPARRMIDLLSRMGWEQRKGPEDPLFKAMQRSVDRVGRDVDQELSVFAHAVNDLEASIQDEERAAAAAIAEPIAAALKQEKMAESAKLAKNVVALRIGTGEVIAVVEAFLEKRWVSVLTVAYSVEDGKPGAVNNATRAMDELIWSVRPKLNADDRKLLIAKLPGMLATLNQWLDVIKWQDAERLQFFAELAECHASIVRAPLDLSPERQLEISVQVAKQAAERRLELQAKADAADKAEADARASRPELVAAEQQAAVEVEGLRRGMWLAFAQPDGGWRKVKLAWISPLRTLYIFSTAARQEAFSMSGEHLARQLRERTAQVARNDGVVSHALSEALARGASDGAAAAARPPSGFGFG
ncbi:DUF1631 family protein [Duganella sp. CF517]|uniref:DUF1631 family protein n=1 Tax=Duganella sp. CF517 TaxID=1881038 RepID=UPI000B7D7271|nr:DUF1631 family protein [Duganella sp. CF517]